MATSSVDRARPAPVNTQNGMISRRRLTFPSTFHTQRLFRKNTGTAQIITATTFDLVGSRSSSPTAMASSQLREHDTEHRHHRVADGELRRARR